MSECHNFWTLSHLLESIDVPAGWHVHIAQTKDTQD